MRKNKFLNHLGKITLSVLLAGFVVVSGFGTNAMAYDGEDDIDPDRVYRTEVINTVSLDDINIHLAQYEILADGTEIPLRESRETLPGAFESQIVRVNNIARPAWIRILPEFENEAGLKGVGEEMFVFANDYWKKCGDYYYYLYPVATGETIEFIKKVRMPSEWGNETKNKSFRLYFTAEAVQIENFTPDFNSDDPWFGTPIEICVHNHYDMPVKDVPGSSYSVVFRNGAEGLVRLGDDWFTGFNKLMPGDTMVAHADIGNNYAKPVEIYFWTENIVESVEDDKLLNALELEIKSGDEVIFSGKLSEICEPVLLGKYYQMDRETLSWTLYVPWQLRNAYALTNTKTKWIFEARLDETAPNFETGDTFVTRPYIIVGSCGIGIVLVASILLLIKKRKEAKNNEK